MLSLPVLERLASALARWAKDWERQDYRQERVNRWLEFAKRQQLRRDHLHVHYLSDRQVLLGDALEAWLCDLWLFIPLPGGNGEPGRGLWCCVYPAGLERMPVPEHEHGPLALMESDAATGARYLRIAKGAESPQFSCFVADALSPFKRSPQAIRWSRVRSQVAPSQSDLLAQLCLLALRQEVADDDVYKWLVNWAKQRAPHKVQPYLESAVSHAVGHFILPLGSLKGYLRRVARGLAQEGQAPEEVRAEADQHGVSVRSIYRWREKGADAALQAQTLDRRRKYAALAGYLAEKEGIARDAARKRIARRLGKGETLRQIAATILTKERHQRRTPDS